MPTMSYINLGQAPLPLETVYALTGGAPDMLAVDFVNDRALRRDSVTPANNFNGALSLTGITDTHGQTIYADDAAGAYSAFAANVLVRTSRGLQAAPTRTRLHGEFPKYANSLESTDTALPTEGIFSPYRVASNGAAYHRRNIAGDGVLTLGTTYVWRYRYRAGTSPRTRITLATPSGQLSVWGPVGALTVVGSGIGTMTISSQTLLPGGDFEIIGTVTLAATETFSVGCGPDTVTPGQYVDVIAMQVTDGTFAVPWIMGGAAGATVAGNQQVISGIPTPTTEAGLAVINLRGSADTNVLWSRNDGTANEWMGLIRDGASLDFRIIDNGATVADLNLGTLPVGRFGFAYTVGAGYARAQIVSGATVAALAPASFPTVTQWSAGDGYSAARDAYLNTERMALAQGVTANDATFAAWLARAASALAA